ncbi:hypothetical protein J7J83_03155 [bacterium]|nr:hypothetical protein [bacterium]
MSISDDIPPSDDVPPSIKKTLSKINDINGFNNYLDHLLAYHTHHLSNLTHELQERLMLQGLDYNDLYTLHQFLEINLDNGIIESNNKDLTRERTATLKQYL